MTPHFMTAILSLLRRAPAVLAVAAALTQGAAIQGAAAAAAPSFDRVDEELRASVAETDGAGAARHLDAAQRQLNGMDAARSGGPEGAGLEITARTAFIETLRNVPALDHAGDVLESVRTLTRLLDLGKSLSNTAQIRAAKAGTAREPEELDGLVTALYQRLEKTAALKPHAAVPLTASAKEKLLYRTFALSSGGHLTAFELVGNEAAHTAAWREARFQNASEFITASTDHVLQKANVRKTDPFPFVLALAGDLVSTADFYQEERMQGPASDLAAKGLVPLVISPPDLDRPYTRLPSVEESDAPGGKLNDGAVLIHRKTGTEIFRWPRVSNVSDLKSVGKDAADMAAEISRDIGPASDAAGAKPPEMKSLLTELQPQRKEDAGKLFAAGEPVLASVVDSIDKVTVDPQVPLLLNGMFSAGWAQYRVRDSNLLVWLRPAQVEPFRPRPDEEKRTDGKDSKGRRRAAPSEPTFLFRSPSRL